jgi:hypothetical protein
MNITDVDMSKFKKIYMGTYAVHSNIALHVRS